MVEDSDQINVLHIDDEPDFARLTARNLERVNDRLSVQYATEAAAGYSRLSHDIDCVVSDYQLIETNGLEVMATVRDRYPDLPFILFTDTGSEKVASEAISAGVTDYLIKGIIAEQYSLLATKIVTSVEQRRAEQRAAETERQLHELAEHTNDVLWLFSADWSELLFINSAYEDVFEEPIEEVREQPDAFIAAIHPDDRESVQLTMQRISEGNTERVEYRIDTDGPHQKWVESQATPIVEEGTVVRVAGFTRDITERKRWEQELAAKNDKLERFASMVAHDLRNPWNVADGFLQLAREERDSEELQRVSNALDRMNRIVTDLLALARAGATISTRRPVSIDEAVRSSWDLIDHPRASLRVTTERSVLGDPSRLAQVFENLFRNSIEHSDAAVTITVGELDDAAGFYVEDDGPGIPDAERERVMESGYSTSKAGTGFGLAIVTEVVEAHGWEISLTESEAGGARFEITGVEIPD